MMKNNYINLLKTSLLLLVLVAAAVKSQAQTVFTYTAGPAAADDRKPLGVYFGFERSQFIYTAAELGPLVPGSIVTRVAFFLNSTNTPPGFDYDYKVYLKEQPYSTCSAASWATLTGNSVLVASGSMPVSSWSTTGTWIIVNLPLNSQVTTGGNLEFLVETNWASSASTGFDPNGWFNNLTPPAQGNGSPFLGPFNAIMFTHNIKTASGQYWNQDNTPPANAGSVQAHRPNVQITSILAPPCAGVAPAGVITSSSANPVCVVPFTLNLALPPQSGFTFQWFSSTVSNVGPWTLIAGATQAYYQTTQVQSTWYYCQINCGVASSPSTPVQVISTPVNNCYCGPNTGVTLQGVSCVNNFINAVSLNTLINAGTGCSNGTAQAYTVYPPSGTNTTTIRQGQTYNLSVTTGGTSQSISVYIDWNHDGDFIDPGEWYGLTGTPPVVQGAGTYTMPITVPTGLSLTPFTTGMRVRSRVLGGTSNDANTPCTTYFSGETEDYLITVDPVVLAFCGSAPASATLNASPLNPCSGGAITLSLSPDPSLSFQGYTYTWQYDNSGAWANLVPSSNASTTVTSQSRYTQYRCLITCGSSIFSSIVAVTNRPTTWLGRNPNTNIASSEWADPANWCGHVPTTSDSVLIDKVAGAGNPSNYLCPIVGAGTAASAYQLKLVFGDSLIVKTDSANSFTVSRDINNYGYLDINSTKADTIPFYSAAFASGTFTPFKGLGITDERTQLMYDSAEFSQQGMLANDVIDTLYFHFYQRASTKGFQGFKIAYAHTTDLQFGSNIPYHDTLFTTIYTVDTLRLYSIIPGTSGTLKIPVTGFRWDGHRSIVLQICWQTANQIPNGNDLLYITQTSFNSYLQLTSGILNSGGCTMVPGPGIATSFTPNRNRPNITFRVHRKQLPMTSLIGTVPGGGGINNNGNGSKLNISNANLTVNGAINNDGVIAIDSSNITINASFGNTGDFLNNGTNDWSYSPVGLQRKSTINFNGTNWINSGTQTGGNALVNWNGINWTNNGIINPGTSRVVFMGTANQVIGGTNPSAFYDLRMQKGALIQPITLNKPIIVNDTLSLGYGKLVMNGNSITLNDSNPYAITKTVAGLTGVIVCEDTAGTAKVNWNIRSNTATHVIPFANLTTTHYLVDSITNTAGNIGMFSMSTYAANAANQPYPNGVNHINTFGTGLNDSAQTANRYWYVGKTGPSGTTNITFAFSDVERCSGSNSGLNTTSPVNPARAQPWGVAGGWRTAPAGQLYSYSPTVTNPPTYLISRVNFVKLSGYTWTYGNSNAWAIATSSSPLPIHLASFSAKGIDNRTQLNWITASEENNDYFTVQRTLDFNKIENITTVASHQHTSNTLESYQAWDEQPAKGVNYYRLLQTDFGGDAKPASDYVAVRFDGKVAFDILYISNETQVQIIFDYDSDLPVDYTVSDMLGKTISSGINNVATAGVNILKLDASTWPHGMYLITLNNKDKSVTRKMVY